MVHYLIKISPEMAVKSDPVRRKQLRQMRRNVRRMMRQLDERIDVRPGWDRIDVYVPGEDPEAEQRRTQEHGEDAGLAERVIHYLQRMPGAQFILLVDDLPWQNFEDAAEKVTHVYRDRLAGRTFAVRVKRRGEHSFSSQQLEQFLGGHLLKNTDAAGVNLKHPEIPVNLEVKRGSMVVVRRRYPGQGGFPIGTQEPVLSLISGGFDSAVSSYMAIRRGLQTHFLFFNLGGTAHEAGVRQMVRHLWSEYESSHRVYMISVPFEGVIGELMTRINHAYRGVILKRMMLRAAERIANEMHISGLVTGESISQVSSQTPINLGLIDQSTDMLVLRPLVFMNKDEIIDVADRIGAYWMAANMPEYCGVISDRPTTRAKKGRIERDEDFFDDAVLEAAVANRIMTPVDQMLESEVGIDDVPRVNTPSPGDVVIDIRHPGEAEDAPLTLTNNEIRSIPFYELNHRFAELDAANRYLLYCDEGSMSTLHAGHLIAEGHENVVVYDPSS